MNDKVKPVISKWGTRTVTFSDRPARFREDLLAGGAHLCKVFRDRFGIDLFVCYGVLLGFTRGGDFIPHDDDFDLAYVSTQKDRGQVLRESVHIVETLLAEGYEVKLESYGQYKVRQTWGKRRFKWEIFVGWIEDDQVRLYFAIDRGVPRETFLPMRTRDFYGVNLPIPNQPEAVCEAIYGPGWRTPDPDFRYQFTPQKWQQFAFLFSKPNLGHWNDYYSRKLAAEPWSVSPSPFASFVSTDLAPGRLLEVGCGNGRDSLFFASRGMQVTAVDYSLAAVEFCSAGARSAGIDIGARELNVYDIAQVNAFVAEAAGSFDYVYARFFLHAITELGEENFWRLCAGVLRRGGRCFVEFRTNHDRRAAAGRALSDSERVDGHYRRFLDVGTVRERAQRCGLETVFETAGTGLAVFRDEDPHVGRLVMSRS